MAYDLSTYEGRQEARDAGNWVGADSSGNIVMEPSGGGGGGGGGAPAPSGGGGGGGGLTATDGQTLGGQSAQTQADFQAVYGSNAEQQWVAQHNAAIAGAAQPGTPGTPTPAQPPLPTQNLTNLSAAQQAIQNAMNQAYQAYLNSKLNLDTEQQAWSHAQQAFTNEITKAGLTGMYEGQPTMAAQLQQANLLGTYQGQPTLAAQAQQFGQGITAAGLTGTYQGAITQQAQEQAFRQSLAEQTQQQKVVQDYLTLLSGLRGPQDYGQYLRTMASTPQGLQSLVGAAAGQNRVGFGTTGVPPQAVTLPGFMNQAAGGTQSNAAAMGATPGTTYADYQAAAQNLPPPSQIAPQNWNAMTDSQRKVLLSMYESNGWNVTDAQQQYQASLPKYAATTPATGAFRLV